MICIIWIAHPENLFKHLHNPSLNMSNFSCINSDFFGYNCKRPILNCFEMRMCFNTEIYLTQKGPKRSKGLFIHFHTVLFHFVKTQSSNELLVEWQLYCVSAALQSWPVMRFLSTQLVRSTSNNLPEHPLTPYLFSALQMKLGFSIFSVSQQDPWSQAVFPQSLSMYADGAIGTLRGCDHLNPMRRRGNWSVRSTWNIHGD